MIAGNNCIKEDDNEDEEDNEEAAAVDKLQIELKNIKNESAAANKSL